LTKWKVVGDGEIEGIEIVYDVGNNFRDPLVAMSAQNRLKLLAKLRLSLQRIN
jgi:hypothetical protein